MNSKEKFLDVATQLFSKYGFSGVSVRDIAKEMGMRESAMYKHYASKLEILESIIQKAKLKIEEFQTSFQYNTESLKSTLCMFQEKLFDFYTLDIFMNRFRKIMIISQYENKETSQRYKEMFINKSLNYYENIFSNISAKFNLEINAKLMAYELYSTLFLLLQQFDDEENIENFSIAKTVIKEHIESFINRYAFLEAKHEN